MTTTLRVLALSGGLALAVPCATVPALAQDAPHAHYEVRIHAGDPWTADVHATIDARADTLSIAPWGHPGLPDGWGTFVEPFTARVDGRDARVADLDGGRWAVTGAAGHTLDLQYRITFRMHEHDWSGAGGDDARPAIAGGALFAVTKALFVYDESTEAVSVELIVPEGWGVSTPWMPTGRRPGEDGLVAHGFDVPGLLSLVNNAVVIGPHVKYETEDGDLRLILALDQDLADARPLLEETLREMITEYRAVFDGTPAATYVIAFRGTDGMDDGEAFEASFNQMVSGARLDGRFPVWGNTLAHELFHVWDDTFLVGARDRDRTEWFNEGFTEYYANRSLYRRGLVDEDLFLRKMGRHIGRVFVHKRMFPGGPMCLADASADKHRNWLYVYGGGASLAFQLDILIREGSGGERTLDDLMRLVGDRAREADGYELEMILDAIAEVGGEEAAAHARAQALDPAAYPDAPGILARAGLEVAPFADEVYIRVDPAASAKAKRVWASFRAR